MFQASNWKLKVNSCVSWCYCWTSEGKKKLGEEPILLTENINSWWMMTNRLTKMCQSPKNCFRGCWQLNQPLLFQCYLLETLVSFLFFIVSSVVVKLGFERLPWVLGRWWRSFVWLFQGVSVAEFILSSMSWLVWVGVSSPGRGKRIS